MAKTKNLAKTKKLASGKKLEKKQTLDGVLGAVTRTPSLGIVVANS
jgi:hypothetical protein